MIRDTVEKELEDLVPADASCGMDSRHTGVGLLLRTLLDRIASKGIQCILCTCRYVNYISIKLGKNPRGLMNKQTKEFKGKEDGWGSGRKQV